MVLGSTLAYFILYEPFDVWLETMKSHISFDLFDAQGFLGWQTQQDKYVDVCGINIVDSTPSSVFGL